MRPILILFFLIISLFHVSAQQAGGQGRDSARYKATMKDSSFLRNMSPVGKVIGILRDSASRQPLEFASVVLMKVRDSSVAGGSLTDEKGHFRIEDQMPGRYFIRITSIGYRQLDSKPFMLSPQEPLKDFGNVWMPPSQRILKEAEIVGEKAEYSNTLDKKVYNVDKTMINAGGSVSEVLQNIPSVNVDIDGKISLRGSEQVTILIDGKPAGLTGDNRGSILQQLPASSIDQIEVVTNPSSKYDAEGMSGIINIKTKKDKNPGLNGTVTLGAGTNDKYNTALNLNRRTRTHNAFLNYSFRDDRRDFDSRSTRTNTYGDTTSYFLSTGDGRNDNISHNLRGGLDFYLDDYNTLGFSGGFNQREEKRRDLNITTLENAERQVVSGFDRLSVSDENSSNADGSLDYRRTFANSKRELTANVNLNRNERDAENTLSTFLPDPGFDLNQRIQTEGVSYNGTAQVDYILPKEKYKIETGLKASYRNNDNRQRSDRYDFDSSVWNPDSAFTDRFIFDEVVYAAYLQWSGRWKVFDLSAGLRAEQTFISGDSKSADTTFTRDFLNLFPSGAVKYSFSEGRDLQLSYSRRINRPREQQLNPFRNVSDSLNIFTGNPGILPELTHSLEFGYIGRYGEQNVSASVFYRLTEDNTQRFRTVDTLSEVSTQTFVNYRNAQNLGLELVFRNSFLKIFTTSLSLTAFYNKVDATNIDNNLVSDAWSGDVRGSVSARITKQFSAQLTGNYMAPREQPQGTFRGMSGIDFGFRYDFKGGKWSLNGSITDIFDTRNFDVDNTAEGVRLQMLRKRESRVASFTLSYRFGKAEATKDRRRGNRQNEQMQPQNDMMDF
ncbi:MAG: TonB-dependent receptor [Bacteroidia bacterium]|nr:TonB-dependent receptor [Bacteroidia bacterium]